MLMALKPRSGGQIFIIVLFGIKTNSCRAMIIAGLMATGYTPLIHAYLSGGIETLRFFPWQAAVKMLSADLFGVLFYITRFPESRFPETFDIWVWFSDTRSWFLLNSDRVPAIRSSILRWL